MRIDVAVIGGSGMEQCLLPGAKPIRLPTPFGLVEGRLAEIEGVSILAMSRHGAAHQLPPSLVGYKAMADALHRHGAKGCISTAAVGSLRMDWPPGTLAICSDFIDLSFRNATRFSSEVVHYDFTSPFPIEIRDVILEEAKEQGLDIFPAAVYVCTNGPRFETAAEIEMMIRAGADIVGMTVSSEATLMREYDVPYGSVAVVTNLAAGLSSGPITNEEVLDTMKIREEQVARLVVGAALRLAR